MRAPLRGCWPLNSSRIDIRPGISASAKRISLRPHSARLMSFTLKGMYFVCTSAIAGGNVSGILDMLKGAVGGGSSAGGGLAGMAQNMVYKSIAGNFISKATSQLGLSEGVASSVSGLALPMIMEKIGGAAVAAGDTDEIDEGSVMSAMGLDAGGLMGKAKDLLGGSGLGNLFG